MHRLREPSHGAWTAGGRRRSGTARGMRANAGGHDNSADAAPATSAPAAAPTTAPTPAPAAAAVTEPNPVRTARRRRHQSAGTWRDWCGDAPAEVRRDPALRSGVAVDQYLANVRGHRRHAGHLRPLLTYDTNLQPVPGTRRKLGSGQRLQADQAESAQGRPVPQRSRVHQRRRQVHCCSVPRPDQDVAAEPGRTGQGLDSVKHPTSTPPSSSPSSPG